MQMGKSSGFLLVIVLLGFAFFLIESNKGQITANQGRLQVREHPGRDAVVLKWTSGVEAPMGRRFEEAYDAYKDKVSLFIVELDSPGGSIAEGKRVVRAVERMAETHELETRVGRRDNCLSMCVPIFLKGERRIAAPDARFMFHEPAAYDAYTGERASEPEYERRLVADMFFERYFENSPMDPGWRAWLEREWVGKDVWKSGRELMDEGSNVVTDLQQW